MSPLSFSPTRDVWSLDILENDTPTSPLRMRNTACRRRIAERGGMAVPQRRNTEQLLRHIEKSQLGYDSTLQGPFGAKKGLSGVQSTIICHWRNVISILAFFQLCTLTIPPLESELEPYSCASRDPALLCRSLGFIEDYLRREVLPRYGNTHSSSSFTSRQTGHFREEARSEVKFERTPQYHHLLLRLMIRNAVNASEKDAVIFVGSGSTGAVHKLIHCLRLRDKPHPPPVHCDHTHNISINPFLSDCRWCS